MSLLHFTPKNPKRKENRGRNQRECEREGAVGLLMKMRTYHKTYTTLNNDEINMQYHIAFLICHTHSDYLIKTENI